MTENAQPSHPDFALDEALLLDDIESLLSPEQSRAVDIALTAHPQQARLMRQLRADRAVLRSLPPIDAPASLRHAVAARIRQSVPSASTPAALPVSRIVPVESPSILSSIFRPGVWHLRAAMAAGLLIGLGLTAWGLASIFSTINWSSPSRHELVHQPAPDPSSSDPSLADSSTTHEAPLSDLARSDADDALGSSAPSDAIAAADHAALENVLTPARSLELARQGRLVLVVRGANVDRPFAASSSSVALTRHALDELPASLASLARPGDLIEPLPGFDPLLHAPAAFASDTPIRVRDPKDRPIVPMPAAIYTAELRATEYDLDALVRAASAPRHGEAAPPAAAFRVLAHTVALDVSTDPRAVLWWARPPSEWSERIVVPVLVLPD